MIKAGCEAPCPRPGPRFQIQIRQVVENEVILSRNSANDEKLVFVDNGSMAGPTPWSWTPNFGLGPSSGGDVEDNNVGEIFAMLIFTTKYNQFVALV